MSTLAEIEAAIAKLPPADVRNLLRRLNERAAEAWDWQIEEDARSGKLDALYVRLMEEEGSLPKVSLDEVLDDPTLSQTVAGTSARDSPARQGGTASQGDLFDREKSF